MNTRSIRLKNITKTYNGEVILENLNLEIPGGQFFALLGPSGSGKTTILRLIAGFEQPETGSIYLGEEDITNKPIYERKTINTVFQHYALFPNMNVFENVAYSLTIRKMPEEVITQRVMKALAAAHLEKQVNRPIQSLSGGQQQRVSLARAIINEPEVLLLDEPLAALDLKLRERMLIDLIDLQSTLKTTFLYVTHDQFEALTVADQMAIMNADGQIEQVGTPKEIYEFPVSTFVAKFVGSTNIFSGVIEQTSDDNGDFKIDGLEPCTVRIPSSKQWATSGKMVYMSLRPEKIEITKKTMDGFSNHWQGVVQSIVYHGRSTQYNVRLKNGLIVQVFEQNEEHFETEVIDYDDQVNLYWQKENVVLLEQ